MFLKVRYAKGFQKIRDTKIIRTSIHCQINSDTKKFEQIISYNGWIRNQVAESQLRGSITDKADVPKRLANCFKFGKHCCRVVCSVSLSYVLQFLKRVDNFLLKHRSLCAIDTETNKTLFISFHVYDTRFS
jgi:hypothetical protein